MWHRWCMFIPELTDNRINMVCKFVCIVFILTYFPASENLNNFFHLHGFGSRESPWVTQNPLIKNLTSWFSDVTFIHRYFYMLMVDQLLQEYLTKYRNILSLTSIVFSLQECSKIENSTLYRFLWTRF